MDRDAMTHDENYFFDVAGYLIVRNALNNEPVFRVYPDAHGCPPCETCPREACPRENGERGSNVRSHLSYRLEN